ncbi:helix-turn-helix domain-containing protein [Nocardia sp. NPDC050175]|uniref:helix-turn-helix domain-containing protein n=1 Tax=Nocardia sp. NPDC050175 TaxID=3364317 RepID=UPI00378CF4F0
MDNSRSLGPLLREYRDRLLPTDLGLPRLPGSRRTPGLRRAELAELAGVSEDYIKRLEQGRSHPSASVVNSLARALRLSQAEYEQLSALSGHAIAAPGAVHRTIDAATQQLLERLGDTPVAVYDAGWTLLAYNAIGVRVFGEPADNAHQRNMAWRFFMEPANFGWASDAQEKQFKTALVADLRDAANRYPHDADLAKLIAELRASHGGFDDLWCSGSAAKFVGTTGVTHHPNVGLITLDANALTVPAGDLKMVVFTAKPGTRDAHRLTALGEDHTRLLHYPQ